MNQFAMGGKQGEAMNRAGLFASRLMGTDLVDDSIHDRLLQSRIRRQHDRIDFIHQPTNTEPWPQLAVTTFLEVRSSIPSMHHHTMGV